MTDVDAELATLEATLGVSICFHDLGGRLEPLVGSQRIQHRSRFCAAAKRQSAGACTACDAYWCQRLATTHPDGFWKVCHAGLLECYVPLLHQGWLTAAAFIGQWRWTGNALPDTVHRDPQTPQPPRPAPQVAELNDPEQLERILVFARLLAGRLEKLLAAPIPASPGDRAGAIRVWIANRVTQPVELSDLAAHLNLSASRTGHLVRSLCGCTFPALLLNLRLAKARNLLALTELSVIEIASRCGFTDHRYFHRRFKQAEGSTPDAWRRARQRA